MLFSQLKNVAAENNIELNPKTIHIDFEKDVIKAIQLHFPNAKIIGCHFHFTNAIYKQVVELGLITVFRENKKFKLWICSLMCFPFLMLGDIDDTFEAMLNLRSQMELEEVDDRKLDQFIDYFRRTWLNDKCHFSRKIWNLYGEKSSRTNNICESYNHQINGKIISSNSNIYKVITVVQKAESLASTSYERVNVGQEKKPKTAQQVKDAKIETLKVKYRHCEITVLNYLKEISAFIKEWDE